MPHSTALEALKHRWNSALNNHNNNNSNNSNSNNNNNNNINSNSNSKSYKENDPFSIRREASPAEREKIRRRFLFGFCLFFCFSMEVERTEKKRQRKKKKQFGSVRFFLLLVVSSESHFVNWPMGGRFDFFLPTPILSEPFLYETTLESHFV